MGELFDGAFATWVRAKPRVAFGVVAVSPHLLAVEGYPDYDLAYQAAIGTARHAPHIAHTHTRHDTTRHDTTRHALTDEVSRRLEVFEGDSRLAGDRLVDPQQRDGQQGLPGNTPRFRCATSHFPPSTASSRAVRVVSCLIVCRACRVVPCRVVCRACRS
jgi:hypothetical protein